MCDYRIGEFGVCIMGPKKMKYMIAGIFTGKEVPDGFDAYGITASQWEKFTIQGPLPETLQTVYTWVWNEWLPNNGKYEHNGNISFEWYSLDNPKKPDYQSGIWLPVKEKSRLR